MQGTYSYINEHYANAFGHYSENLIGQPYYVTMHPDDRNICHEVSLKCFANPDMLFPATIRKHDGKGGYVITQWEYKAMFDEENNPSGIFCVGHDITTYISERKSLETVTKKAHKTEKALKQLSFNQSHLVRAPVANIIGLANILDKMEVDTNTRNIYSLLLDSANQLDTVINDIVHNSYEARSGM